MNTSAQQKAQIDLAITSKTTAGSITPVITGNELKSLVDYTNDQVSTRPVNAGLVANSTFSDTTLILAYDINVIATASNGNYACKLPQPVTGKTVKLINKADRVVLVYPSNVGGQIGNNLIDQPVQIPNDGKVYEFICVLNPDPGKWAFTTAPTTRQIVIAEIFIDHVNGVMSNFCGITQAGLEPAVGIGVDGNGNVLLNGEWLSENIPTTLQKIRCETNILSDDMFDQFQPSRIAASIMTGYMTAVNSATSGERHSFAFLPPPSYVGFQFGVGELHAPIEIGDTATLWDYKDAKNLLNNEQLGIGGPFSRYFYSFAYNIPANADTKTYKFRWVIDVI
jgi:hypothetical protein